MLKPRAYFLSLCCIFNATSAIADIEVPMYTTEKSDTGKAVGSISISETEFGLLFTPKLHGLKPGIHGFHIHENPACGHNGMDAGGHLDPNKSGKHLGPYNNKGHLGDLPTLYVNTDGTANNPVLAPRLKHLSELQYHSLMIHEGGDNYSDQPDKLGGGGLRMECGIIE